MKDVHYSPSWKIRQAKPTELAFLVQGIASSERLFEWSVNIRPVQIKEVNALLVQTFQTSIELLSDARRRQALMRLYSNVRFRRKGNILQGY